MAIKELKTRIALKYDTYANWTDDSKEGLGANLVLLKGEMGICEVKTANGHANENVVPTVLFKVGDGETPFKELPWASAKAADVYSWAKSETVVLNIETDAEGKETGKRSLDFKTGETVNKSIDLSSFATDVEVAALEESIGAELAVIKAALGLEDAGDGESIAEQIESIVGRLEAIEGAEGEDGLIATTAKAAADKALEDANAYTDAREVEIKKYADDAEADAIKAVQDEVNPKFEALGAKDAELEAAIEKEAGDRETAINDAVEGVTEAYEAADDAINAKFGAEYDEENTVADAIEAAKTEALGAVETLKTTEVKANADAITALSEQHATDKAALEAKDAELTTELERVAGRVDTFFALDEGESFVEALDTLKEIQDYLNGEGEATGGIIDKVAANETAIGVNAEAIKALQDTLATGGDFEKRVADVEAEASANTTQVGRLWDSVDNLEDLTDSLGGMLAQEGPVYAAIGEAKDAADAAQKDVDDLAAVVNGEDGLVKAVETNTTNIGINASAIAEVKVLAEANETAIGTNTTNIGTNTQDIADIKAIVVDGDDANEKLRADIDAVAALINGGDDAAGIRAELTALQEVVDDEATGLAATKKVADDAAAEASANSGRLDTIEADYLKAADEFIINCGSATTVVHVKPTQE